MHIYGKLDDKELLRFRLTEVCLTAFHAVSELFVERTKIVLVKMEKT